MNASSALHPSAWIVIVALVLSACTPPVRTPTPSAIVATPLPHSAKGYELYSWQANDQWHFALVTGTNRAKSLEEIISNENTVTSDGWVGIGVQGVDAIQNVLSGLPQHEEILWVGKQWLEQAQVQADSITLPPQEIIDVVQGYCKRSGLELQVSK
jgi:hypothetical protein